MVRHVVQQGEHLAGIAHRYGYGDYRTIWEHPRNAELRRLRDNPNVLLPGDSIVIPDKREKGVACATTATHRFRLGRRPLQLRVVLRDFDGMPLADCACEVRVGALRRDVRSDRDGLVSCDLPADAQDATLAVPDLGLVFPLRIGHLDPVHADTGWRARLVNLGYQIDADAARLRAALEEFQCDHGLPVTGAPDAATRARLLRAHGC